jgi:hypothetical protein
MAQVELLNELKEEGRRLEIDIMNEEVCGLAACIVLWLMVARWQLEITSVARQESFWHSSLREWSNLLKRRRYVAQSTPVARAKPFTQIIGDLGKLLIEVRRIDRH